MADWITNLITVVGMLLSHISGHRLAIKQADLDNQRRQAERRLERIEELYLILDRRNALWGRALSRIEKGETLPDRIIFESELEADEPNTARQRMLTDYFEPSIGAQVSEWISLEKVTIHNLTLLTAATDTHEKDKAQVALSEAIKRQNEKLHEVQIKLSGMARSLGD